MFKNLTLAFMLTCAAAAQEVSPWVAVRPHVAKGKVEQASVDDGIYKRQRKVWAYTPVGYDAHAKPYALLIVFDGADYHSETGDIPLPAILDNLIAAGKVPPMVALMIDTSEDRRADLNNNARFGKFLSDVFLPWAQSEWNITRNPDRTIVTGYSAGGLGAANVAFFYPQLFGNALCQSGAFWRGNESSNDPPYEWLTSEVRSVPRRTVNFYIEVGGAETQHAVAVGPVFIEANRRFRDALRAKRYSVTYKEIPGAQHEPNHWKNALPDGLIALTQGW